MCHGNNPSGAPSNSRSSNNANMLVRGSLPWHETRTHKTGRAGKGERDGEEGRKTERGVRKGALRLRGIG